MSWEELKCEEKKLACLLNLFAFAPIPWDLVKECLPEEDPEDLEDIRDCVLRKLSLLQDKMQENRERGNILSRDVACNVSTRPTGNILTTSVTYTRGLT